ncbi:hypothetical protein [Streptomyces sp. NPDC059828]
MTTEPTDRQCAAGRIVRLIIDDITDDGTTVTVRLGDPPSPLPKPSPT